MLRRTEPQRPGQGKGPEPQEQGQTDND